MKFLCLPHDALLLTAVLGFLVVTVFSTPGQAVDLKPKIFPLTILGVRVGIPVTVSFDARAGFTAGAQACWNGSKYLKSDKGGTC